VPGMLDFAVNVRASEPPSWLVDRLTARMADLGGYPSAADQGRALHAVAARHGRSVDDVALLAGAAEGFALLANLRPRLAALIAPSFTEPEAALATAGVPIEHVVLAPPFGLAGAGVPDAADLVVVGNPTNPTSVLHPAADIAALARPGRTVVVDEAFMDCVPGEPESLAARLPSGVVVVRSLTKTWGLAGLRAGYLLADPHLVDRLADAQPLWAVSTPALVAVEACSSPAAVAEAETWALELSAERDRLAGELTARGLYVVPESRASFLCLRVPDALGIRALLRQRGYAVRRGDTFPGLGPDWLRIAVRGRAANDVLLEVLGELGI
jgi:histidinol-phosphate aminotransferase